MRSKTTLEERFWPKVSVGAPDECWIWTGATCGRPDAPYGRIWGGKRSSNGHPTPVPAHRVSYELLIGPIPDGLTLDHLCLNTLCVNPTHLEPVAHKENLMRGTSPMAKQARQTHCKRGHLLDEENTYVWTSTKVAWGKTLRRCRKCNADAQRQIRERSNRA